jgi:ADP-ribose pyrophosphatase YjhB (NUDIX family)
MGIANVTRPCAFVFLRAGDRVAVSEMIDPDDGTTYYRPAGGGIEFGERSGDAARRELQEELDLRIGELALLGVLENVFQMQGEPYHEICFVFEAPLEPDVLDRLDGVQVLETTASDTEIIRVLPRAALDGLTLYPDGVRALLQ